MSASVISIIAEKTGTAQSTESARLLKSILLALSLRDEDEMIMSTSEHRWESWPYIKL